MAENCRAFFTLANIRLSWWGDGDFCHVERTILDDMHLDSVLLSRVRGRLRLPVTEAWLRNRSEGKKV